MTHRIFAVIISTAKRYYRVRVAFIGLLDHDLGGMLALISLASRTVTEATTY